MQNTAAVTATHSAIAMMRGSLPEQFISTVAFSSKNARKNDIQFLIKLKVFHCFVSKIQDKYWMGIRAIFCRPMQKQVAGT